MSELLPNLATVADELCVIRSMFTTNPNHEQARSMFHQGSMILSRPSMGSWISYGLGTENKNLPAFMVLAPDGGGFTTSGFLPAEFQGTFVQHVRDGARQDDPLPAQHRARAPMRSARSSI